MSKMVVYTCVLPRSRSSLSCHLAEPYCHPPRRSKFPYHVVSYPSNECQSTNQPLGSHSLSSRPRPPACSFILLLPIHWPSCEKSDFTVAMKQTHNVLTV